MATHKQKAKPRFFIIPSGLSYMVYKRWHQATNSKFDLDKLEQLDYSQSEIRVKIEKKFCLAAAIPPLLDLTNKTTFATLQAYAKIADQKSAIEMVEFGNDIVALTKTLGKRAILEKKLWKDD